MDQLFTVFRKPTPRVVFDCNLFVQGIANRNNPARKVLRLFFNEDISLFVSEPIIREGRDVLNRVELRRKLSGINDRIVNAFLTKQRRFSSLTSPRISLRTRSRWRDVYQSCHRQQCHISREPG